MAKRDSCFCPIREVLTGPPIWTYDGFVCVDETQEAATRSYDEEKPYDPDTLQPCPCSSCPFPIAEHIFSDPNGVISSCCEVYEKAVPNPGTNYADEPIRNFPILGEYTADIVVAGVDRKVRLIHYAVPKLGVKSLPGSWTSEMVVRGVAYLIKKGTPKTPIPTMHFGSNLVKLIQGNARFFLVVMGKWTFDIQYICPRKNAKK